MATDYDGLKAEIQQWLDNDNPNLVAAIPTFIGFAENSFRRHLHVREMECRATTELAPSGVTEAELGIYALPDDWGGHRSVEIVGANLVILYWKKLPSLGATVATNWLLDKHSDLYLYTSLSHSEGWLKNDPRIRQWAQAASNILQEIEAHDEHDRYSGGPIASLAISDRPWRGASRGNGRLDYLPPFDFFELENAEMTPRGTPCAGWFTVAEDKIRIWPKPSMPSP